MLELKDNYQWFFKECGTLHGPFSTELMIHQFNLRKINPNTPVKTQLMNNWLMFNNSILGGQKYTRFIKSLPKEIAPIIQEKNIKPPIEVKRSNKFVNQITKTTTLENHHFVVNCSLNEYEIKKIQNDLKFLHRIPAKILLPIFFVFIICLNINPSSILFIPAVFLSCVLDNNQYLFRHRKYVYELNKALDLKAKNKLSSDISEFKRKALEEIRREEKKAKDAKEFEEKRAEFNRRQELFRREVELRKADALKRKKLLFKRHKGDMGPDACAFYILDTPSNITNAPVKLGITDNVQRRLKQHRKKTNFPFRIHTTVWFKNREHASEVEQAIIKSLVNKGVPRAANEFFMLKASIVKNQLKDIFVHLSNLGSIE